MTLFGKGRDHVLALFRIVFGFGLFGAHATTFGVWPSWWASLIQFAGARSCGVTPPGVETAS